MGLAKGIVAYASMLFLTCNAYAADPEPRAGRDPFMPPLILPTEYGRCARHHEMNALRLEAEISLSKQTLTLDAVLDDEHKCMLLEQRIISGKKDWRTPALESEITKAMVNPIWMPSQKIYREMLHDFGRAYLNRILVRKAGMRSYMPAGPGNFLGKVKFYFSNPYGVMVHGTRDKDKQLFEKKDRYFSHGCIRIEDEVELLKTITMLVGNNEGCDSECIDRILEKKESKWLHFKKPVKLKIKK